MHGIHPIVVGTGIGFMVYGLGNTCSHGIHPTAPHINYTLLEVYTQVRSALLWHASAAPQHEVQPLNPGN